MKKLLIIISIVTVAVAMVAGGALAKVSSAHINDTPSIKEMQSKPCPKVCYATIDPLGNKTATQTDNSGKNYLGR